ncbi:NAD(+)/NADH kinase [Sulfurimonas sp. MAG313]|nr:NAD(+)/NADH kinase [Sulfurimonas sp. MAG313]MDF1881841.1 NAD(+)/NADH kinase [Sulfurimonas sp. MAG313]
MTECIIEKPKQMKRVGLILRPSSPEMKEQYLFVKKCFEKHHIEVFLDNNSAQMIGLIGKDFDKLCENSDVLVTLGGDGTLISVVRRSHEYDVPVFGIHAGKLGFLADIDLGELDDFVSKLVSGDYRIDNRAVLRAEITTKEGTSKIVAFNDIVMTRSSISKMIHLDTFVDEKPFNTYYGDGVIVSTPTGSTAYNLSAGGPVLFPLTQVFALTPISPHSLTQRPVVLPGHFTIEMRTPDSSALVVVDGQDMYEFGEGDIIKIRLSGKPAQLIHRQEFNYFEVLKEKLSWGE